MGFFTKLNNGAFASLIRDQRLKDVVIRREFRISAEYVRAEVIPRLEGEELRELALTFRDGYGELAAKVTRRYLPWAIPVSARFAMEGVTFNPREKKLFIRLEEVRPLDMGWLTRLVVERLPFFTWNRGILSCDLTGIPRLAELFDYRVKGVRVSDYLTIKELMLREGELVGRLGVVL
jgi:hypothetical protein